VVKNEYSIVYERYTAQNELQESDRELLKAAGSALLTAYAPYSKFQVGAAARLANGQIEQGSNQENAAFSQCVCAEQNLLTTIGARHPGDEISAIAVTAQHESVSIGKPVFPCGSCRQILTEFRQRQESPIRIILQGAEGDVLVFEDVSDLLPFAFSGEMLG